MVCRSALDEYRVMAPVNHVAKAAKGKQCTSPKITPRQLRSALQLFLASLGRPSVPKALLVSLENQAEKRHLAQRFW